MPRTTQVWSGVGWGGRDSVFVLGGWQFGVQEFTTGLHDGDRGVTWWTLFAALNFSVVSLALAVLTVLVLALAWMAEGPSSHGLRMAWRMISCWLTPVSADSSASPVRRSTGMATSSLVIPDWSCLGWASPALILDLDYGRVHRSSFRESVLALSGTASQCYRGVKPSASKSPPTYAVYP